MYSKFINSASFYIYCFYLTFTCLFVVFDWLGLDIAFTPFVNAQSKECFWTNQNITGFLKKCHFDKILFDIYAKRQKKFIIKNHSKSLEIDVPTSRIGFLRVVIISWYTIALVQVLTV